LVGTKPVLWVELCPTWVLKSIAGCQKLSSVDVCREPDPDCADLECKEGDMYENDHEARPQLRGECGELNGEFSRPGLEHDESNDDKCDHLLGLPRFGGQLVAVAPGTAVNDSRWKGIFLGDPSRAGKSDSVCARTHPLYRVVAHFTTRRSRPAPAVSCPWLRGDARLGADPATRVGSVWKGAGPRLHGVCQWARGARGLGRAQVVTLFWLPSTCCKSYDLGNLQAEQVRQMRRTG